MVAFGTGLAVITGCGAKTQLPLCGGSTGVSCIPTTRDASKTTCACICDAGGGMFHYEAPVPACLPEAINSGRTPQNVIDADANYGLELQAQCDKVADAIKGIAALFFPLACNFAGCQCSPRRVPVGNQLEPFVARNSTCDQDCPARPCVKGDTCRNPLQSDGTINVDRCDCNQVTACGVTSAQICRPPPGTPDPPPNHLGILTGMLAQEATLAVDPTLSSFNLVVTTNADGGQQVVNQSSPIHGEVLAYGAARQDASADVLLDLRLTMDEMHFSAANQKVDVTYLIATGGAGTSPIRIDVFGNGTIPMNTFALILDFTQNGQRSRLETFNAKAVSVHVDYANKTFHVPSIAFDSQQGLTGNFELAGTIVNQAPVARVKPDQTLECTSPAGASATLDGSASSDADGNINNIAWARGEGISDDVLAGTAVTQVVSPIGTRPYTLQILDGALQGSIATTHVTVRDTTAPVLSVTATPTCLWAPNHKLVVYELGKDLPFQVADTCDPKPTVEIVGVASSQVDLGGGQGNFTPDILFGKKALCLRSEREGTTSADRVYTVTVRATDTFGNATTKTVAVTVPHDEGMGGCPKVEVNRLTDAGDPRCQAN